MQCVILAGGLATRMKPMTLDIPKSMIEIDGKPFLEHQLELLKENDVKNVVVCVGHLGHQIKEYFKKGEKLGMNIKYGDEKENLLGTAGALKNAGDFLADEFFLMYGDSYVPVDFQAITSHFKKFNKKSLMVIYKNADRFDKSNIEIEQDLIKSYDKKNNQGMLFIDAGVSLLKKEILRLIPPSRNFPLERIYQHLIKEKEMLAYQMRERFYQIGSFEGLEEFKSLIKSRFKVSVGDS